MNETPTQGPEKQRLLSVEIGQNTHLERDGRWGNLRLQYSFVTVPIAKATACWLVHLVHLCSLALSLDLCLHLPSGHAAELQNLTQPHWQ